MSVAFLLLLVFLLFNDSLEELIETAVLRVKNAMFVSMCAEDDMIDSLASFVLVDGNYYVTK